MKRQQIVTAIGVFIVGFGLGYGATWILVSDDEPGSETTTTAGAESTDVSKPENPQPTNPTANPPAPDVQAEETSPEDVGAVAGGPDTEPEKKIEAPKEVPWWKACLGKKSKVDFGGVRGGLSIRRGSIKHGSIVDWNLRFKNARRMEILPTDRSATVVLRAVGLSGSGQPVAAEIEWKTPRQTIVGVISLQPGDKRVTMQPVQ